MSTVLNIKGHKQDTNNNSICDYLIEADIALDANHQIAGHCLKDPTTPDDELFRLIFLINTTGGAPYQRIEKTWCLLTNHELFGEARSHSNVGNYIIEVEARVGGGSHSKRYQLKDSQKDND